MLRCSRFLPALIITFAYACIVPASILVRMHSAGWRWIWNDPAFGFFMVLVFPFAVAVFSCVVDTELLKRSVTHFSTLTIPVILFGIMLLVMPRMVYLDLKDVHPLRSEVHRLPQPYMYLDAVKMMELNSFHEHAFATNDLAKAAAEYKVQSSAGNNKFSPTMLVFFFVCNFINVGFGVALFCYILLVSVAGKIGADVCNHLVFVLAAGAVWFPARAYADWFINLGDFSWISTYQAAAVMAVLFIVGSIILALRMVEGSLYHRFVLPAGAISAIVAVMAALKPHWLTRTALTLEAYDPIYRVGLGLIVVALLFDISSTIHQKPS
jgi:hypothetical protein